MPCCILRFRAVDRPSKAVIMTTIVGKRSVCSSGRPQSSPRPSFARPCPRVAMRGPAIGSSEKEDFCFMPRHVYGFFVLGASIALLTLAALISAFAGQSGPNRAAAAAIAGAGSAPQAAATQVAAAQAAKQPQQPQGVWTDIATFPAVVVSPTPGTNPLRIKRAGAAAYFPNGNVYLLGGRHGVDGEDVALRWIWQYAPSTNTWTQKTALLDGSQQGSIYAANMAMAVLTNANGVRIYAVGGSSIDSVPTPVTRVYDPVADALTTDDPWPASPARVAGGWGVYNNVLYVF